MKRIIAMLLCLVLLTMALVSCSSGDGGNKKVDRPNLTLRMAVVVSDNTTPASIAAMQKAFNDSCEVALSTHIEFECIKASEYRTRMDAIMNEVADEKRKQNAATEDAMANADTAGGTEVDGYSKYPAASKAQFDILLIADRTMYEEYVKKGWIVGLKADVDATFKVINTKLLNVTKSAAMIGDTYYGIPSNKAYGSYRYLMVNAQAASFYGFDVGAADSLSDAYTLLTMMKAAGDVNPENGLQKWQNLYPTNFSVIRDAQADFLPSNVVYLSSDFKKASLVGTTHGPMDVISYVNTARNLLRDQDYARYLTLMFDAKKSGYFGDGTAENFLIGTVKGNYELRDSNPLYHFIPIELPTVDKDEIFGGMLAVSSYSVNQKRSLEIVQEFMTNSTKTNLLNIVLFGDPKTNYSLENGCVSFIDKTEYYGVHPDYLFGNLRELAYPCADYGQNLQTYEYAAKQNADADKKTPLLDTDFAAYFAKVDKDLWAKADTASQAALDTLMESADLDTFLANLTTAAESLDAVLLFENTDDPTKNVTFGAMVLEGVNDANADVTTLGGAFYKYKMDRMKGVYGPPSFPEEEEPAETPTE